MRILVVSAHFPPNFVSGGTLVPDRQARELIERGHQVEVFAGWLGDRPALDRWTDTIDGLTVHWVSVSEFIGWNDPKNFDHPAVIAHFESALANLRPEVVHLHSLQTLGGGLVSAAKRSGARTVVTMHDFWWVCARQFLVDREMQPCSVVVECGTCACENGFGWSQQRRNVLLRHLANADVVLAPSRSAAVVLRANGVTNVEVDENGIDPLPTSNRVPRSGSLRVRYTGGSNDLKGPATIVEAAKIGSGSWSIDAHGIDEYLEKHPDGAEPATQAGAALSVGRVAGPARHERRARCSVCRTRVALDRDTRGPGRRCSCHCHRFDRPAGGRCRRRERIRHSDW